MQDIAAESVDFVLENQGVIGQILPGFTNGIAQLSPQALEPMANDFSRLTSQLPLDTIKTLQPQLDTAIEGSPFRGVRMLLNIFARTPESYLDNINGAYNAAKKAGNLTPEIEEWYHRMHRRGLDMYGGDWVTAQLEK